MNFSAVDIFSSDDFGNLRVKVNPQTGDIIDVMASSRPLFKPSNWEAINSPGKAPKKALPDFETEEMSQALFERLEAAEAEAMGRSAQRAKRKLKELALCNAFDLFFTMTLSPDQVDRYDYKEAVRRFGVWMANRVRRNGLKYVAVPELHKDGAIHFHGLCNAEAVELFDSGKKDKAGRKVFNLPAWSLGFTTAVKLSGDYGAVCSYISKYITKQADGGTIGGRYYFHGGDLREPVVRLYKADFEALEGREYEIPEAALTLKYLDPSALDGVELTPVK